MNKDVIKQAAIRIERQLHAAEEALRFTLQDFNDLRRSADIERPYLRPTVQRIDRQDILDLRELCDNLNQMCAEPVQVAPDEAVLFESVPTAQLIALLEGYANDLRAGRAVWITWTVMEKAVSQLTAYDKAIKRLMSWQRTSLTEIAKLEQQVHALRGKL